MTVAKDLGVKEIHNIYTTPDDAYNTIYRTVGDMVRSCCSQVSCDATDDLHDPCVTWGLILHMGDSTYTMMVDYLVEWDFLTVNVDNGKPARRIVAGHLRSNLQSRCVSMIGGTDGAYSTILFRGRYVSQAGTSTPSWCTQEMSFARAGFAGFCDNYPNTKQQ